MVVALTGFLGLFRDAGLSMAAVQRTTLSHEQASTLFWINVIVGLTLFGLTVALAPAAVHFYREPELLWMTIFSGLVFLINGLSAQHMALLQRHMRFADMALIDIVSLALSITVSIVRRSIWLWLLGVGRYGRRRATYHHVWPLDCRPVGPWDETANRRKFGRWCASVPR
jgi:O-antigen/teichoic acid export membrane protein